MTFGLVGVAVAVAVTVTLSFFRVVTLSDTIFTVGFTVAFLRFFSVESFTVLAVAFSFPIQIT